MPLLRVVTTFDAAVEAPVAECISRPGGDAPGQFGITQHDDYLVGPIPPDPSWENVDGEDAGSLRGE